MKKGNLFLVVLTVLFITTCGNAGTLKSPLQIGWAIGYDASNTAVILHTKNGGRKWVAQGNNTKWEGYSGNDISAVDKHTAWAALGSQNDGIILHTTNGGATWTEQTLPENVDAIKGIKGLSRHEAWAVSLTGTILHTTDGGKVWNIVDSGIDIGQVNRMDAIGCRDLRTGMINANVWIVDEDGGDWGMIHSLYNGELWRQENVPHPAGNGMHMVSAYSPRVVWAATTGYGYLYRTLDGGENWENVGEFSALNDFDDMCAPSPDTVWAVLNLSGQSAGTIYHVRVFDGRDPEVSTFNPAGGYAYEGLTCVDDQTALAVGLKGASLPPSASEGVIVSTTDGGQSWVTHPLPVDDVGFWKVSFVGARR